MTNILLACFNNKCCSHFTNFFIGLMIYWCFNVLITITSFSLYVIIELTTISLHGFSSKQVFSSYFYIGFYLTFRCICTTICNVFGWLCIGFPSNGWSRHGLLIHLDDILKKKTNTFFFLKNVILLTIGKVEIKDQTYLFYFLYLLSKLTLQLIRC